ncbi:hypothetical protein [Cyanobium sp. ATX 6F1]|uniref:hypothetical protein n=1 Tax=unclassified Cyanobium TaxID=2627006 RepID=UPI0020CB6DA2|nr:hypothetical protein [Cyanobium sp. ATX 6F1]MCP9917808.1 hypothetical protein [Cyanobium sp. ATX 6F1]
MAKSEHNFLGLALGIPGRPDPARVLLAALPLLALTACGAPAPPPTAVTPPPLAVPQPPAPKPPAPEPTTAATPVPGLTPLPTPAAVVGGIGQGRLDPFAPVASAGSTATDANGRPISTVKPVAQLPAGFSFTGVVSSRGTAQALVQVSGQTGPLCVGPRGFCPGAGQAPLLPPGWIVTTIDVNNGRLSLRQGKDRVNLTL